MKKLISILTSLTLLTALTGSYVDAVESDDPELYTIARSLGADTNCLKIVNYTFWDDYTDDNDKEKGDQYSRYYIEFLKKNSLLEGVFHPIGEFTKLSFSGSCVGISLLEILAHNGVFSSSDIQDNVKNMSDITFDDDVDKTIFGYQWVQAFNEFALYEKYLTTSFSYQEQVDRLIGTAESCMSREKYFLITFHTNDISHAVCGIGIADGSWEYNGVNYDKCILTLDSNCIDGKKNSTPFSNKCCIYINSETKQSYIPAYDIGDETDIAYGVIDDDSLLNYKGVINPSEKINTDISSLTEFGGASMLKNTKVYAVTESGEKYDFYDPSFDRAFHMEIVEKLDSVQIEADHEHEKYLNFRYINTDRWIDLELLNEPVIDGLYGDYNAVIDINDNKFSIENFGDEPLKSFFQIRMNDGTFDFAPYFWWSFNGNVNKDLTVEIKENGMLLSSDEAIDMNLYVSYYILDDDGNYVIDRPNDRFATSFVNDSTYRMRRIKANNNVLVTVEDGDFVFLLDTNGDGIYNVPVEKGDVNFDGSLDASDASDILQVYAELSTGDSSGKLDPVLFDHNGDGAVDSADASDILAYYANQMTE